MIQWCTHYETGIADLDKQHRELFAIAGKLSKRAAEHKDDPQRRLFLIQEMMVYLRNYFIEHVEKEEAYMREIGFAGYRQHKKLHDAFRMRQMAQYTKIVENGICTYEELSDFIGNGVGWFIEHITTSDMEIVKGHKPKSSYSDLDTRFLEAKINELIIATLNIDSHVKAVDNNYRGDSPRKTIYQKSVFLVGDRHIEILSGIEQSFMMEVGQMLYGERANEDIGLILSTLQSFGSHFWKSILLCFDFPEDIEIQESVFLTKQELQSCLKDMAPTVSILFDSDKGELFFSSCL